MPGDEAVDGDEQNADHDEQDEEDDELGEDSKGYKMSFKSSLYIKIMGFKRLPSMVFIKIHIWWEINKGLRQCINHDFNYFRLKNWNCITSFLLEPLVWVLHWFRFLVRMTFPSFSSWNLSKTVRRYFLKWKGRFTYGRNINLESR